MAPLTPGVGFTPLSRATNWKNHDGTAGSGVLNQAAILDGTPASLDARYGAGSSSRWYWTAFDNENLRTIGENALRALFQEGTLGAATVYDGNPTTQELEDAAATGDARVLAWAHTVPADATPVPMDLPGEPCGVFWKDVPPYGRRPVLNTSKLCVPVAPAPPAPADPSPPMMPTPPGPVFANAWLARVSFERMVKAFGGRVAWPFAAVIASQGLGQAVLDTWLLHVDAAGTTVPIFVELQKEFSGA